MIFEFWHRFRFACRAWLALLRGHSVVGYCDFSPGMYVDWPGGGGRARVSCSACVPRE